MKLTFAGDISLFKIDPRKFKYSIPCIDLFNSSDLVIGNLECPLTTAETKEDHQAINMSASIAAMCLLKPFNILSLANNHIRDFGEKGLKDTINALEAKDIQYFGAGRTCREALKPLKMDLNGHKIAFVGATRFANATKDNFGGTASDKNRFMFKQIQELKLEGFFVVMYLHWGYEYVRIPSPRDRKIAHRCMDSGADLVIGSHPHIYQGIEDYKGKKIVYSLGNFIFHSSVFAALAPIADDPRLNESFVFSIELDQDQTYTAEITGYQTDDSGVKCYDAIKNSELKEEVLNVSKVLTKNHVSYLRAYYMQAYEISRQNSKIKREFQHIDKMSVVQKILLYKNANLQDVANKIAGTIIGLTRK